MRLIDADVMDYSIIRYLPKSFESIESLCDVWKKLVENQPTAYDVDKVVEQLEEDAKFFQSEADGLAQVGDFGTATEFQGKASAYRDAIKTVKSGGIE